MVLGAIIYKIVIYEDKMKSFKADYQLIIKWIIILVEFQDENKITTGIGLLIMLIDFQSLLCFNNDLKENLFNIKDEIIVQIFIDYKILFVLDLIKFLVICKKQTDQTKINQEENKDLTYHQEEMQIFKLQIWEFNSLSLIQTEQNSLV